MSSDPNHGEPIRRPRRAAAAAAASVLLATALEEEEDEEENAAAAARLAVKRQGGKATGYGTVRYDACQSSHYTESNSTNAAGASRKRKNSLHDLDDLEDFSYNLATNTAPARHNNAVPRPSQAPATITAPPAPAGPSSFPLPTAALQAPANLPVYNPPTAGYNTANPNHLINSTVAAAAVAELQRSAQLTASLSHHLPGLHSLSGLTGQQLPLASAHQSFQAIQNQQRACTLHTQQVLNALQNYHQLQQYHHQQQLQQQASLHGVLQAGLQGVQALQQGSGAMHIARANAFNPTGMTAAGLQPGLMAHMGGGGGAASTAVPGEGLGNPPAAATAAMGLLPPANGTAAAAATAAAVGAPPRKRGRAAAGGAGACAKAPLVPGNGSKFFPKESQVARHTAKRLEAQLRQLVPPGVQLDWSDPIARLELACYRVVEDLCAELEDPLDAAIAGHTTSSSAGGGREGPGERPAPGVGQGGSGGLGGGGGGSGLLSRSCSSGGGLGEGVEGGGVGACGDGAMQPRRLRQLSHMKQAFLADLQEAIDDLVRARVDAVKQAAAKQYADHMAGLVAGLPPELCGIPENVPGVPLPPAVLSNREPYFSVAEWRKQPFPPRPYETLTSYAIRSTIASECAVLRAKLRTRRPDGAAEHFTLEHTRELGLEDCKRKEAQLAAAVRSRAALVLGQHVVEVDCWGMDCYTRRNIFDAVRESGAFKHHRTGANGSNGSNSNGNGSNGDGNGGAGSKAHGGPRAPTPPTAATSSEPDDSEAAAEVDAAAAGANGGHLAGGSLAQRRVKHEGLSVMKPDPECYGGELSDRGATPELKLVLDGGLGDLAGRQGGEEEGEGDESTRDDEAIAAALAAEEADTTEAEAPSGARRGGRGGRWRKGGDGGMETERGGGDGGAGVGQPGLPPPPPACDPGEADAINNWIDRQVLCTAIAKGRDGWNLLRVLEAVQSGAKSRGDKPCARAASAVIARLKQIGWAFFRLHPKGRGVVCAVPEGLPAFTFVEEYLGELHSPWRWFEIQDAIKKLTQQELPDFYNITLERPRDDPDGYDVMFVEAAFMASFASRMSHSCTPNCAAVVVSVNGRLTIAMYAKRHIEQGEELTFDYSSVTESEKEYREAICLCGSRQCRGSYLYYSGSTAFTQIMEQRHNFLHRQVVLLRASTEPPSPADSTRLRTHSLGPTSLGDGTQGNNKAPDWLIKWAALVLEYVEAERVLLPSVLTGLPPHLGRYTPESAAIEAEAIAQNRVQQIVITLDKVKHVLRQPGQLQTPPMRLLSDGEVVAYLWSGANSVAKRLVKAAATLLCPSMATVQKFYALWTSGGGPAGRLPPPRPPPATYSDLDDDDEEDGQPAAGAAKSRRSRGTSGGAAAAAAVGAADAGEDDGGLSAAVNERLADFAEGQDAARAPRLAKTVRLLAQKVATPAEARQRLLELETLLRTADREDGGHTAAADMLHLYGNTLTWFTAERGYKGFASPPIELHEEMIKLHRLKLNGGAPGGSGRGRGGGGSRRSSGGAGEDTGSSRGGGAAAVTAGRRGRRAGGGSGGAGRSTSDYVCTSELWTSEEEEPENDDSSDGGGGKGRGGRGGKAGGRCGGVGRGGIRGGRVAGGRATMVAANRKAGSAPPPAVTSSAALASAPSAPPDLSPTAPTANGRKRTPSSSASPPNSAATSSGAGPRPSSAGRAGGKGAPSGSSAGAPVKLADPSVLSKRYGPWFMWGQLSGWYKQTVYDPTASLSAERRGTLSLPDVESCYGARARYTHKDRAAVLRHLETCPDAQWKTSLPFSFRNDAKIYGSPMFDQVYLEALGTPDLNPMPAVLAHLKSVKTPLQPKGGR